MSVCVRGGGRAHGEVPAAAGDAAEGRLHPSDVLIEEHEPRGEANHQLRHRQVRVPGRVDCLHRRMGRGGGTVDGATPPLRVPVGVAPTAVQ